MRRAFGAAAVVAAALGWSAPAARTDVAPAAADPWARLPEVLARIVPPRFPARECAVAAHGCRGDGRSDCTEAIRASVEECHRQGGGHVVLPAGDVLTGPIRLQSHVDLQVPAGTTLRFSTDPARYLPPVLTRFEGVELMGYAPLVSAPDAEDVAITGQGTLDGQADADHWWPWKDGSRGQPSQKADRDRLFAMAEAGTPVEQRVFGAGHFLRPAMIEPYRSRNVLVEGVTLRNSPFWVIHPVLSTNVSVRGVTVVSHGPNNDGCDPESSTDVLIEDTTFDTGDDCIAIKSGRNADGRRVGVPNRNVVVRGCRMRAGHGGVTIGSEVSGGVSGVWAEKCRMSSPELDRALRIKTNAMRGGVVEGVYARDIEVGEVRRAAIEIDMQYEEGDRGPFVPVVRDVLVERMTVARAAYAFWIAALDRSPVRGLVVRDSRFSGISEGSHLSAVGDLALENVVIERAPGGHLPSAPPPP
jgi:polygalacturonase